MRKWSQNSKAEIALLKTFFRSLATGQSVFDVRRPELLVEKVEPATDVWVL